MNIYPDGQILKEEALEIKKKKKKKKTFENDEFLTFTASKENACESECLWKWKILYCIREKRANREADEVLGGTANAWMGRLREFTEDYDVTLLIIWRWTRWAAFLRHFQKKVLQKQRVKSEVVENLKWD